MALMLSCPRLKNGLRSILYCLYKCPKGRRIACPEYTGAYPQLLSFVVEQKYIEKYGHPEILVPITLRKRRKRRAPDSTTLRQ